MTKENETPDAEAKAETAESEAEVLPEKRNDAAKVKTPPVDEQEEGHRRAVIFASFLLIALAAPVFAPVDGERSLWRMTRHDDTGRFLLGIVFGWPICLGILGIVRGFRRRLPGKTMMGIATTLTSIQTLGGLALIGMLLAFGHREKESPLVWLGAATAIAAVIAIVRSFVRTGWHRWQHLMAPLALLALMIVLVLAGTERRAVEHVSGGGWIFLFATAALFPFAGATLVARKS
ncbi:MAG TPA: hypothetical protein PK156_46955 [Polyangium sp.]|nr:hypothetical protein [Polyangium sp.]